MQAEERRLLTMFHFAQAWSIYIIAWLAFGRGTCPDRRSMTVRILEFGVFM